MRSVAPRLVSYNSGRALLQLITAIQCTKRNPGATDASSPHLVGLSSAVGARAAVSVGASTGLTARWLGGVVSRTGRVASARKCKRFKNIRPFQLKCFLIKQIMPNRTTDEVQTSGNLVSRSDSGQVALANLIRRWLVRQRLRSPWLPIQTCVAVQGR